MAEPSFTSNFKWVLGILVFFAIVGLVFVHAGEGYAQAAEKNVINAFTKKRFEDFQALDLNSLDMVFVGSSHAYCTFDPENFDKALGTWSFQMGTPLQHPDTTYYELEYIYKTQTPKVVVMEVYWDMLDDAFEPKQADAFFQVLPDTAIQQQYIKEGFPLGEKVKYKLLPIRYQQDYFAYEAAQMEKELEKKYGVTKKKGQSQVGKEEYRSKGYVYCDYGMLPSEYDQTNQFRSLDGKKWEMVKTQEDYMKKIAALCQEKGSRLIFVTAPIANVSMDYIKNYDRIHSQMAELAEDLSVPYIDYNTLVGSEVMLTNENFRDDAHLNDSGVKIVNEHFLQVLSKGYF